MITLTSFSILILHAFQQNLERNMFSLITIFRSSRPGVFCKKGVLRNFAKFTGKHLCQSLFFNKVAGAACNQGKHISMLDL